MGYYTTFEFDCSAPERYDETLQRLSEIAGLPENYLRGEEAAKWYSFDEAMTALSLEYPDLTFRLAGVGEGEADIWVCWFRDGKQIEWVLEVQIPQGFTPPGGWS
ncbi:MAG: hypothetical protein GX856_03250 [Gammaproteobacteria bacterium]|nr:hypothetical protein [Gammaproteobacteria bacterium]